jgi:hypothetical protein
MIRSKPVKTEKIKAFLLNGRKKRLIKMLIRIRIKNALSKTVKPSMVNFSDKLFNTLKGKFCLERTAWDLISTFLPKSRDYKSSASAWHWPMST